MIFKQYWLLLVPLMTIYNIAVVWFLWKRFIVNIEGYSFVLSIKKIFKVYFYTFISVFLVFFPFLYSCYIIIGMIFQSSIENVFEKLLIVSANFMLLLPPLIIWFVFRLKIHSK